MKSKSGRLLDAVGVGATNSRANGFFHTTTDLPRALMPYGISILGFCRVPEYIGLPRASSSAWQHHNLTWAGSIFVAQHRELVHNSSPLYDFSRRTLIIPQVGNSMGEAVLYCQATGCTTTSTDRRPPHKPSSSVCNPFWRSSALAARSQHQQWSLD